MTVPVCRLVLLAGFAAIQLLGCSKGNSNIGKVIDADGCVWTFARYEPSTWERQWYDGELSGERRDRECEVLATREELDRSVRLIRAVNGIMLNGESIPTDSIELFSRMVYTQRCGEKKTGRSRAQLIEPLVGILRDPLTICPRPEGVPLDVYTTFQKDESWVQSKRHFVLGPAAPWSDTPNNLHSWRIGGFGPWVKGKSESLRTRQTLLFDIGASVYEGWHGNKSAVGALWLVDRANRQKVGFDWIVSFEYEKVDPDLVFASVPSELLPHYIYYNQGVEKAADGKWNPWRILKGMGTTANDYVVVKLDIDNPDIETSLMEQLAVTPSIYGLVDEMFFEHHVNSRPMREFWDAQHSSVLMRDSYRSFTELRSKGVRMHSWP
jgi:hypothetical protein